MMTMLFDTYLDEKIKSHVAGILDTYIVNPDDVELVAEEIVEAVHKEVAWNDPKLAR
jgi:hypothetical protein